MKGQQIHSQQLGSACKLLEDQAVKGRLQVELHQVLQEDLEDAGEERLTSQYLTFGTLLHGLLHVIGGHSAHCNRGVGSAMGLAKICCARPRDGRTPPVPPRPGPSSLGKMRPRGWRASITDGDASKVGAGKQDSRTRFVSPITATVSHALEVETNLVLESRLPAPLQL